MPAAPRHPPREAWSGGWAWARVPGLRIHQPERAQYPGSTLGRAGRLDLRAAAAASSAGLNSGQSWLFGSPELLAFDNWGNVTRAGSLGLCL